MTTKKRVTSTANEVSREELTKAAVNTPDENTIKIGNVDFILKDFKYKDYMVFVRYLAPMFELFMGGKGLTEAQKPSALGILDFCETDLPAMALMVAHHTDPDMTEDELLELAPSPFELAELVLAQIGHNRIIEKLTGFLQLMTPRR